MRRSRRRRGNGRRRRPARRLQRRPEGGIGIRGSWPHLAMPPNKIARQESQASASARPQSPIRTNLATSHPAAPLRGGRAATVRFSDLVDEREKEFSRPRARADAAISRTCAGKSLGFATSPPQGPMPRRAGSDRAGAAGDRFRQGRQRYSPVEQSFSTRLRLCFLI